MGECLGKIDATQQVRRWVSGVGKENGDSAGSRSYQQRVTPGSSTQEKTREVVLYKGEDLAYIKQKLQTTHSSKRQISRILSSK